MTEKEQREAVAIKKIDDSADTALKQLQEAALLAKQTIEDACKVAVRALERPDRKINGSYQWDRGDRMRTGSDDRLLSLEGDKRTADKRMGHLEVGQAKREEQIVGLIGDCEDIKIELGHLREAIENINKESSSRTTTLRELVLNIKDTLNARIDANAKVVQDDKIKTQQYIIGIAIGVIITFISGLVFGYYRL